MKTHGIICKDKNIEKYALENYGRLLGMTTIGIIITALSEYASQRDTDLEACYESFIRSNHLSREWEKHYESWHNGEKQRDTELKEEGKGAEEIRQRVIEILQKVDKYSYCLSSEIESFANEFLSLPAKQSLTDEDIEKWANDDIADHWKHGGGAEYDLIYNARIRGAKAHRDGQIPKK